MSSQELLAKLEKKWEEVKGVAKTRALSDFDTAPAEFEELLKSLRESI